MKMCRIFLSVLAGYFLVSCTDVVQVDVPTGATLVVVDAFINNKLDTQVVRLTTTAPYFSNAPTPPLLGASVVLNDLTANRAFAFQPDGNGNYLYTTAEGNFDSLARIGHKYQLNVSYNGTSYTSFSTLNRTTRVKNILWFHSLRPAGFSKNQDTTKWFPYLIANDTAGGIDYYWIKSFKNGVFYGSARNINVVQDAGGVGTDGLQFIPPVAFFGLTSNSDPLYYLDVFKVEIHSIDPETFYFFTQLRAQMLNAQNGLFALTPQNVKSNIQVVSGSGMGAIGWFNMAAVATMTAVAK